MQKRIVGALLAALTTLTWCDEPSLLDEFKKSEPKDADSTLNYVVNKVVNIGDLQVNCVMSLFTDKVPTKGHSRRSKPELATGISAGLTVLYAGLTVGCSQGISCLEKRLQNGQGVPTGLLPLLKTGRGVLIMGTIIVGLSCCSHLRKCYKKWADTPPEEELTEEVAQQENPISPL